MQWRPAALTGCSDRRDCFYGQTVGGVHVLALVFPDGRPFQGHPSLGTISHSRQDFGLLASSPMEAKPLQQLLGVSLHVFNGRSPSPSVLHHVCLVESVCSLNLLSSPAAQS